MVMLLVVAGAAAVGCPEVGGRPYATGKRPSWSPLSRQAIAAGHWHEQRHDGQCSNGLDL